MVASMYSSGGVVPRFCGELTSLFTFPPWSPPEYTNVVLAGGTRRARKVHYFSEFNEGWGWGSAEPLFDCPGGDLGAVPEAEFGEDALDVILDGALSENERVCNQPVGQPGRQQ